MDSLLNAIVVIRGRGGRFAAGLPLESILKIAAERPASFDMPTFIAAMGDQVRQGVASTVAAAFVGENDRQVDVDRQLLINKFVALASSSESWTWERSEARSLMLNAIENLTRCRMRLEAAARAAHRIGPLKGPEHQLGDGVAANGLAMPSLALSVDTIMQAVLVLCHVARSATAGAIDENGVAEDELGLAFGSMQEILRTVTGVQQQRLMEYSPILTLYRDHVPRAPSSTEESSSSLSAQIRLWLDLMDMAQLDVGERCRSMHPDRWSAWPRYPVNRQRIDHSAALCWQLRRLLHWFTEQKARRRLPEGLMAASK